MEIGTALLEGSLTVLTHVLNVRALCLINPQIRSLEKYLHLYTKVMQEIFQHNFSVSWVKEMSINVFVKLLFVHIYAYIL